MNTHNDLNLNIAEVENAFNNCGDLVKRKFAVGEKGNIWVYIFYLDMMSNRDSIDINIMQRLMIEARYEFSTAEKGMCSVYEVLKNFGITTADLTESTDFDQIFTSVLSGDTVLFLDKCQTAIIISTKMFPNRGIQSPDTEISVHGSKEAFGELMRFNTALIRRRIRDTRLKILQTRAGRRSKTDIAIMYLDDVVRPDILKELIQRIKRIDIDAVLDSGYVEQLIEDQWLSPFPQVQTTERPDRTAAAILEGRIAVIVDNSPFVIIAPTTMNAFFQSPDDYYEKWHIATTLRIVRFIAAFMCICLPGLYIATAVYHPSMIPTLLAFKMAGARQNVPFPAVVEILIMDAAFELLREAGLRLPKAVGGTIGIVGGLIIGQAAVEAGLVSPIVVIIVALTGISGFAIPHIALVSGFRVFKYIILIFSSVLGLLGFWTAGILTLIHLVSLKSFGIPYVFPFASGEVNGFSDFKDTFFKSPLWAMKRRPFFANPNQAIRQNDADEKE